MPLMYFQMTVILNDNLSRSAYKNMRSGPHIVLEDRLTTPFKVAYDRNHYFGFGPIPKPKPKLVDTFGRYRNRYQNQISKGKSSYQQHGVFFQS